MEASPTLYTLHERGGVRHSLARLGIHRHRNRFQHRIPLALDTPHAVALAEHEVAFRTVLLGDGDVLDIDLHAEDAVRVDYQIEYFDLRIGEVHDGRDAVAHFLQPPKLAGWILHVVHDHIVARTVVSHQRIRVRRQHALFQPGLDLLFGLHGTDGRAGEGSRVP